ncbi:hypothetical protein MTP99_015566 [Tenebrio molitor]|nr:hypothetical protein MTP99_015566 [Tenebrio molitor]CAH1374190.1 unnamed protein product [Tenebrio molitor]
MKLCLLLLAVTSVLFTATALPSRRSNPIKCTRPNEHYECGSACQTKCTNLGKTCSIVNVRCNDACYCNEGYARNGQDEDTCIPVSECKK